MLQWERNEHCCPVFLTVAVLCENSDAFQRLHLSLRKTWTPWKSRCEISREFCRSLIFHFFMHRLQGRLCYRPQLHFQYCQALAKSLFWRFTCGETYLLLQPKKTQTPNTTNKKTLSPALQKGTHQKHSEIPAGVKKGIFLRDSSTLTFPWWNQGGILDTQNSKQTSGDSLGCNRTSLRFQTDHVEQIPKFWWQNFTNLGWRIKHGK